MGDADKLPHSIGRHFRVQSVLGAGGTSRVLHVIDERTGQHLALKRALTPATQERARSHALLRQEFHVLSRITHPNLVRAFEYGFADGQPFYTMELLRGRPLSELAPIAWQRLCAIILDLCSPLSMLHACRFVHCDVTARNVIITENGATKLIDFGALTATDRPVLTIAGTPPHMPPELLRQQSLDGRVDMFAIGALAYSMLCGQHAYPARSIAELPQLWTVTPPSLRARGAQVPAALDELIMSLLSLEPSARPLQLAQLVQRLAPILDTAYAPDTASLRAQLPAPKLVGREPALEQFRLVHQAALAGHGAVICFAGVPGSGRSRMLEACALEAIHAGCLMIQVAPEQAASAPFGLIAQVFSSAYAEQASLALRLPAAVSLALEGGEDLAQVLASQTAEDLRQCWRALCADRPTVLLLDDLTRADVASLAHCLQLGEAASELPLLLVAAIESGPSQHGRNVEALLSASRIIALGVLSQAETEQLLRSLFGEAAQLAALIDWVYRAAAGLPRASVELAQHALAQGYVRFVDGQFQVSAEVSAGRATLPEALDATVARAVAALPARAGEALGALSLVTAFGPLSSAQQTELLGTAGWSESELLQTLDELRDAQLIALVGAGYELRSQSVEQHAALQLTAAQTCLWQRRLAQLYEQRGHDFRMLTALHYEYAGERASAYRILLELDGQDEPSVKLGGSELGIALHRNMLAHALTSGAPRLDALHFRLVLVRIGARADARLGREAHALLEQLRNDAGLLFWNEADAALPEPAKLRYCLARAEARFASSPAGEQLAPREAIRQLAETVPTVAAICDEAFEAAAARKLAEQARALRTLSPLLELTYCMTELTAVQLSHGGLMLERWRSLLDRLQKQPEGWPELIWRYRLGWLHYHLGRELAQLGEAAALEHAKLLEAHQHTQTQAFSIRLLHALAHGDPETAAKQRRQRAISVLTSRHEDPRLSWGYIAEIELLDACGDLPELQHTAAWFEAKAAQLAGFRPFAAYARACCLLLGGQLSEAQQLVELQVHEAPALEHAAWALLRGLRAELALAAGEPRLAQQIARDLLLLAAEAGLDLRAHTRPRRVLALACAELGEHAEAQAVLEPWRAAFAAEPAAHTVHAGQLHETYARVALMAGDRSAFQMHYEQAHTHYAAQRQPGLMARLQRLTTMATAAQSQAQREGGNSAQALAKLQS